MWKPRIRWPFLHDSTKLVTEVFNLRWMMKYLNIHIDEICKLTTLQIWENQILKIFKNQFVHVKLDIYWQYGNQILQETI